MNTVISGTGTASHSNFIGGSSAARRIACPASYKLELQLPASARKETSTYADEGSACHAAIAWALNNDLKAADLLGMVFMPWADYPITQELIDDAIAPCLKYFDELDQEFGGLDFCVENRVSIEPYLKGVFGTADVLAKGTDCSFVIDWKFGVGELVLAWYEDDFGDVVPNEQLMFYALGAVLTHPDMFEQDPDWPVGLILAQPRHRDGESFDTITVPLKEIWAFRDKLIQTAIEAEGPDPRLSAGSWCRFCPAKVVCPKHTGPMLDAVALAEVLSKAPPLEAAVDGGDAVREGIAAIDWGETYRLMLTLASKIEPVIKEWRSQATVWLEQGNQIGGYKLVAKRGSRKWVKDEQEVEKKLTKLGLKKDQRMPRELVSAPQAEKLLKAIGKELPAGFFDVISSGVTLAPTSDKRQSANVASIATELGQNLALIMQNFKNETVNVEKELQNG